ncbi:MAG: peptide chain release factor N(5)-glutamine methyltransferase [candidate division Zixibacteria bacterium]|nr:peptide chain release factor N(5)-glutamine methyltransferase [candidate division Zixibacteria bacterium]
MAEIVSDFLRKTIKLFKERNVFEPEVSAERIFSHITGMKRADIYSANKMLLYEPQIRSIKAALQRRINGEPVAYITGECEFYNVKLKIDSRVLVPRPETEVLVDEIIKRIKTADNNIYGLDIGTGSGNIAISLAANLKNVEIIATDINDSIIELAKENAVLNSVKEKIEFRTGELFTSLDDCKSKFDFIVSNPPYVGESEKKGLPVEVIKYEPKHALFAGEEGLDLIKMIIDQAPGYLRDSGFLALEIGYKQSTAVKDLMIKSFEKIELIKDLAKHDRIIIGTL